MTDFLHIPPRCKTEKVIASIHKQYERIVTETVMKYFNIRDRRQQADDEVFHDAVSQLRSEGVISIVFGSGYAKHKEYVKSTKTCSDYEGMCAFLKAVTEEYNYKLPLIEQQCAEKDAAKKAHEEHLKEKRRIADEKFNAKIAKRDAKALKKAQKQAEAEAIRKQKHKEWLAKQH